MKKEFYSSEDTGDFIDCGDNLAFGDDIQLFAKEHGWEGKVVTHNEFWSQRMSANPDAPTWQDYHHSYEEATAYMNENFLPPPSAEQSICGIAWRFNGDMSKWGLYSVNDKR